MRIWVTLHKGHKIVARADASSREADPALALMDCLEQVYKYLDLAEAGEGLSVPATVAAHYEALPVTAGECIACGSCEKNCPFGVPVIENMARATRLFGK